MCGRPSACLRLQQIAWHFRCPSKCHSCQRGSRYHRYRRWHRPGIPVLAASTNAWSAILARHRSCQHVTRCRCSGHGLNASRDGSTAPAQAKERSYCSAGTLAGANAARAAVGRRGSVSGTGCTLSCSARWGWFVMPMRRFRPFRSVRRRRRPGSQG